MSLSVRNLEAFSQEILLVSAELTHEAAVSWYVIWIWVVQDSLTYLFGSWQAIGQGSLGSLPYDLSSRLAQTGEQEQRLQSLLSLSSELTQHHFCYILLGRASLEVRPDPKDKELDFTFG